VHVDPIRVLIVDDEAEFVDILVKRLRKRQLDATGVTSGEAALELLNAAPVDVVALDVKMPGMDGLEVLREIKQKHKLVEVVMLTGHASMEVAVEGMDLGAFDYLMKPIQIDDLVYKIQDACQRKRLGEAAARLATRGTSDS
jgi:DNA-binding NtrC family response regulator